MSAFQVTAIFLLLILNSATACFAQSHYRITSKSDYLVSAEELKMSRQSQKAFDKGSQLLLKGNAAESIAYLVRAIAEYPGHYRAYYNLGVAHFRLGHLDDAEQALQKSIDLAGGRFAPPHFALAMILCQRAEFQQGETVVQAGLDIEPGSAVGKYLLGLAQYGLNRLRDAERNLQEALVRNAKLSEAYYLLGRIHEQQHNAPGATKDLELYLKLSSHGPNSDQARTLLEKIHRSIDQKTDAATIATATP